SLSSSPRSSYSTSFFSSLRSPPTSPLFPYTTLFRSQQRAGRAALAQQGDQVVLVRDAMQYARVPQHGHADQQQHDQANGEKPFRSEEHTSELQSRVDLVCRLLLEKKNKQ